MSQNELYSVSKSKVGRLNVYQPHYLAVIDAWSRRIGPNSGVRANRVLRRMVENYNKTKNPSLRPGEMFLILTFVKMSVSNKMLIHSFIL